MNNNKRSQTVVLLAHALVGWALCGAIMGLGPTMQTMQTTLIIHAVGAPIIFTAISWNYFKRFGYTTPLQTALIFTGFVIFMDAFLEALLIMGSFEMFGSILGTWLPFALIFTASYLTGRYLRVERRVIKHA
jgi:hypothetical protein